MEIVFAMFVGFTFQIVHFCIRIICAKRPRKRQSVCVDCFHAHVQYTANAQRAISCTYGGAVRPMKLNVLYCTDYRERNAPLRAALIGFVQDIAPAK